MRKILVLLTFFAVGYAQPATGNITFTPPAPGKLILTAGSVGCTITGNAPQATALIIGPCNIGTTTIPSYTIPLVANNAYTFDYHFNGDAITVTLTAGANGLITYQAAATPNGGQTASGTGNF